MGKMGLRVSGSLVGGFVDPTGTIQGQLVEVPGGRKKWMGKMGLRVSGSLVGGVVDPTDTI